MYWSWNKTAVPLVDLIPERLRYPLGGVVTVAVYLIGTFCSPVSAENTLSNRGVSLLGLVVFTFALWITSRNRKKINWHTVISGMLMQYIIALFVLRTTVG